MMSTLTRLGIRYDSSTDGKEIIRILKEAYERGEGYDICFVCWQMPGGFGKKLVREMREIFDRDTLKIVTSSYDTEDYEEEMRGAGVDYILKKPVLQSQVYSLISEICSVPETEKNKTEDYDFPESVHCWRRIMQLMQGLSGIFEGCPRRSGMCR